MDLGGGRGKVRVRTGAAAGQGEGEEQARPERDISVSRVCVRGGGGVRCGGPRAQVPVQCARVMLCVRIRGCDRGYDRGCDRARGARYPRALPGVKRGQISGMDP